MRVGTLVHFRSTIFPQFQKVKEEMVTAERMPFDPGCWKRSRWYCLVYQRSILLMNGIHVVCGRCGIFFLGWPGKVNIPGMINACIRAFLEPPNPTLY